MDSESLRGLRAPLKDRYRAGPGAALDIEVRGGTARAEGDLDFRGTLGVDRDAPVGSRDVRLRFELDTDASAEQLASLGKLTERYCIAYQTLRAPPRLTASHAAGPVTRGT